jgi:hypothetical protein
MEQVSERERRQVLADHQRGKLVRMTFADGRSRAFANLTEAQEWADRDKENKPRNSSKITVGMADELKEFVRDSGNMSKTLRGLVEKAAGAQWKATRTGAGKKSTLQLSKPPRAKAAKVKAG